MHAHTHTRIHAHKRPSSPFGVANGPKVRAPKPTQVLLTTEDNCFPYRGGAAAVREATAAFTALGGTLDVHQSIYHHGWDNENREAL